MNSIHHGWSLDEIAPEARRAAERAAEAAGMPLEIWLNQLIKYVSAMELSGKGPARARAIDETIKRAAAEQARIGAVDGPADGNSETPMMLETEASPAEQPTTLAAEVLEPNRFAEEHPGERDIEQAIGEWRKSGALKPLVVRPDSRKPGHYEIVSGMERWHAASRLHMRRIPVTVQQLSDEEVLRATLIQKLNSKSLPPLDEAEIYQRLMEETGLSVAALSDVIGRSPTHVATALQLLDLPEPVREMINSGELSVLHARTLLGAADPEPAAREVVARRLDIYQTEQLVRASHGALSPPAAKTPKPAEIREPEVTAAPAAEAVPEPQAESPVVDVAAEAVSEATVEAPMAAAAPAHSEPMTLSTPAPSEAPASDVFAPEGETAADELQLPEAVPGEASAEAPPADETGISEAPLDMSEYITADMGAGASPAETVDKTAPIILGGIEGDAGTLIEASPAIDSPAMRDALDDGPSFGATAGDSMVPQAPSDANDAPLEAASHPEDAPAETASAPAEATPEPLGVLATSASSDLPAADEAGSGGNGGADDAPGGDVYISDADISNADVSSADTSNPEANKTEAGLSGDASAAVATPGNSGGSTDEETREEPDDRGELRSDDSTRMVETHLTTLLGLKVSIAERNQDDGVLSIHYNSESELTDLVSRLNRMPTGRRAE